MSDDASDVQHTSCTLLIRHTWFMYVESCVGLSPLIFISGIMPSSCHSYDKCECLCTFPLHVAMLCNRIAQMSFRATYEPSANTRVQPKALLAHVRMAFWHQLRAELLYCERPCDTVVLG